MYFVGDETLVDLGFAAARARLDSAIGNGSLARASAAAYREGIARLALAGPAGDALAASRLTGAHFLVDPVAGETLVRLKVRWEANRPRRGSFLAFEAEISLCPAGTQATLLQLAGEYRALAGQAGGELAEDDAVSAATETAHDFLHRVASALRYPAAGLGPAAGAAAR